jgi:hypothetical protein
MPDLAATDRAHVPHIVRRVRNRAVRRRGQSLSPAPTGDRLSVRLRTPSVQAILPTLPLDHLIDLPQANANYDSEEACR